MSVNESGSGPNPSGHISPNTATPPTSLPTTVPKKPPGVNPENAQRMQEQIPTGVPPASASPPPQPLPHEVTPQKPGAKAAALAQQLVSPSSKLMSVGALKAGRGLVAEGRQAVPPAEKFGLAFKKLVDYQRDLEQLTIQSGKSEKKPEQSIPLTQEDRFTFLKKQIGVLKKEMEEAAPAIMEDRAVFLKLLQEDPLAALEVLKIWIPKNGGGNFPPDIFTAMLGRQLELIGSRQELAAACLDSLKDFAASQQIIDSLVSELCKTDQTRTLAKNFICQLLRRDVDSTDQEGTLHRGDNMRTKLYTAYQRERLRPLLQKTLGEAIAGIKTLSKPITPVEPKDIDAVCLHADRYFNQFLAEIKRDPAAIPDDLREIYRVFAESLIKKGWAQTRLNSLLFLRVICPAVLAPQQFLSDLKLEGSQSTNLICVSKAINAAVNYCSAQIDPEKDRKGTWVDFLFMPGKDSKTYAQQKMDILTAIALELKKSRNQ
ncbi:MAG: hypothetical protein LLG04_14300 [Parachlamydia sp.]|nr:hypothetical protein [Parachlamydia sp.]